MIFAKIACVCIRQKKNLFLRMPSTSFLLKIPNFQRGVCHMVTAKLWLLLSSSQIKKLSLKKKISWHWIFLSWNSLLLSQFQKSASCHGCCSPQGKFWLWIEQDFSNPWLRHSSWLLWLTAYFLLFLLICFLRKDAFFSSSIFLALAGGGRSLFLNAHNNLSL